MARTIPGKVRRRQPLDHLLLSEPHFTTQSHETLPIDHPFRKPKLVRPKIKLKKVAIFCPPIKRCFLTTIHHAITTISPANYHQKSPLSPHPPRKHKQNSKTAHSSRQIL